MLVSLFLGFVIVFSGVSIKAYADSVPAGGRYLTVNETREFIGSSFEVTYFDGSDYVTTTATYDSSTSFVSETSENPSGFFTGSTWLRYRVTMNNINSSPAYVTVHCEPSYSLFDTEYIYTCFALSKVTNQGISSSAYQSPNSDWYIAGSNINFANRSESASGSGVYAFLNLGSGAQCSYIPIVHRQQSTFSAYSIDAEFSGGFPSLASFYVMCPYVSDNASGASGTFASSSGAVTTGSGSGSVNVDLSETNGILDSIAAGISGIGDTLVHVFVPTETQIIDFKNDLDTLLDDTFSGIPETQNILDDVRDTIADSSPVSEITFPAVSVPGTHFTIASRTVNLVPIPSLLDFIKLGFDILATCLFINLIRSKFDEIIHGKVVVELQHEEVGVS